MRTFAILILSLACLASCHSRFGKCAVRNPQVVSDFVLEKYLGKWYEQERDNDVPFQSGECTTAEYSKEEGYVKVVNSELRPNQQERTVAVAKAYYPHPPIAKLLVNFGPEYLKYIKSLMGTYWVLDTDYDSFSIVYSCTEILGGAYSMEYIWILTREKEISEETFAVLVDKVVALGYPKERLRQQTKQGGDCIY